MNKKIKLTIALISLLSGHYSFAYDNSLSGETDQQRRERLLASCGHYSDVDSSSVFGEKNIYIEKYIGLGDVSSELDKTKLIKSSTYNQIQSIYNNVKTKKDQLHYAIYKNEQMYKRNQNSINATNEISENMKAVMAEEQNQLNKEDSFITEQAKSDVQSLLRGDAEISSDGTKVSSYDKWQECKSWWDEEQKTNPW